MIEDSIVCSLTNAMPPLDMETSNRCTICWLSDVIKPNCGLVRHVIIIINAGFSLDVLLLQPLPQCVGATFVYAPRLQRVHQYQYIVKIAMLNLLRSFEDHKQGCLELHIGDGVERSP